VLDTRLFSALSRHQHTWWPPLVGQIEPALRHQTPQQAVWMTLQTDLQRNAASRLVPCYIAEKNFLLLFYSATMTDMDLPVLTTEEVESLLWSIEDHPQDEHAVCKPDAALLEQHKKTGFVMEEDLVCVLGDYVGTFGVMKLRRCESCGIHLCRYLKTNEFGDGRITIRQVFYSIKHMRLDMNNK